MEHENASPDSSTNPALRCIERYMRCYTVASVAWVAGLILVGLALLALVLSVYTAFTQRSPTSEELTAFLGIRQPPFLVTLVFGSLKISLPPFLAGLGSLLLGSLLRCSTDAVVQVSPFLNEEQRVRLMGLK